MFLHVGVLKPNIVQFVGNNLVCNRTLYMYTYVCTLTGGYCTHCVHHGLPTGLVCRPYVQEITTGKTMSRNNNRKNNVSEYK
jgi:hypothetical protein